MEDCKGNYLLEHNDFNYYVGLFISLHIMQFHTEFSGNLSEIEHRKWERNRGLETK